jgi:hypothetical protein
VIYTYLAVMTISYTLNLQFMGLTPNISFYLSSLLEFRYGESENSENFEKNREKYR